MRPAPPTTRRSGRIHFHYLTLVVLLHYLVKCRSCSLALRQNLLPPPPPAAGVRETSLSREELCDGDIYCGEAAAANDVDLEQHGGHVEVNICRLDHAGAVGGSRSGSTSGAYLAPSTVVVERHVDNVGTHYKRTDRQTDGRTTPVTILRCAHCG